LKILPTSIPDVFIIKNNVFQDERGFFMETYRKTVFAEAGISYSFVQDNHSASRKGTLRGLHYQIKQPQGKLLRVVVGEIFDVAVDLRRSSPTFSQWFGVSLSAENKEQLWIPPGLAHGFYVVSEWAELVYKATDYYAPEYERTILWNDPDLGIAWPLHEGIDPVVSSKDSQGTRFKQLSASDLFE